MEDVGALFGDARADDDGVVVYGPYTLNVAPKEGRANTLLADQLFSPALLLAEQIELGRVHVAGRTVLELGAGTGLPSLLAAAHGAARVVASDYPDELILRTLKSNVAAAGVHVAPFEWGTDPAALLELAHIDTDSSKHPSDDLAAPQRPSENSTPTLPQEHPDPGSPHHSEEGFDTLLLSDLLHFASSHSSLLTSLTALLARTASARAYVACGRYTAPDVCARFVAGARARGLVLEEWVEICGGDAVWEGASVLRGVGREGMGVRKRNCRIWEGRWEGV